jgi:hypothetical protein
MAQSKQQNLVGSCQQVADELSRYIKKSAGHRKFILDILPCEEELANIV